jgi:arylsulfatase A-like enzyme
LLRFLDKSLVVVALVNTIDVVPTVLALQGIPLPGSMQGEPLPHICAGATPRDEAFSEYGAGGPPLLLADLEALPKPWGRKTLIATLQWREAEGRRKMCRTAQFKYVHDAMGDDLDELYDLEEDPWELTNRAYLLRSSHLNHMFNQMSTKCQPNGSVF